ncbi:MAG: nitroreductase family deazaflavin-dependent oxidoreductase [Thermomicrobiales bacterium]|nr:nitroreductase family deazaflavin-dependent oxidoreductase [Thermomicrobiales bacterium]
MTEATYDAQPSPERWASEPFAYLTTIGRRTGEPHRIEIWFAVEDGVVYLLSGGRDRADWVRNLQANPDVSIELGTETFTGVAQVLSPDSPEDRRARELLVEKYRKGNELDDWGRTSLPVAIRFASMEDRL